MLNGIKKDKFPKNQ